MCPVAEPTAAPIAAPRATDTPIDRALCTSSLIISSKNLISRVDGCFVDFFASPISSPNLIVSSRRELSLWVPHPCHVLCDRVGILSTLFPKPWVSSLLPPSPPEPLPTHPCSKRDACNHHHHFQSLHDLLLDRTGCPTLVTFFVTGWGFCCLLTSHSAAAHPASPACH